MKTIALFALALSACAREPHDHFAEYRTRLSAAGLWCAQHKPGWPEEKEGWREGCITGYLRSCGPTFCEKEER